MGLYDLQSIEWTPAACFLAVQAGLMVLGSFMLILPGLSGCFYMMEPHTKKPYTNRLLEISWGAHLLHWTSGLIGGLVAGGAQITCIVNLPAMLALTYRHYAAGGMPSAIVSSVFMVASVYFGFMPLPTVQSIKWTPAAIFLIVHAGVILLAALPFLLGKTDDFYKNNPHVKKFIGGDYEQAEDAEPVKKAFVGDCEQAEGTEPNNDLRDVERGMGSFLLGAACAIMAAVIAGGAQDMCLLQIFPLCLTGYNHFHFWNEGGKASAVFTVIIIICLVGFGLWR